MIVRQLTIWIIGMILIVFAINEFANIWTQYPDMFNFYG